MAVPVEPKPAVERRFGPPEALITVRDERIDESSGLVAARRHPDRYYTANDGAIRRLYLLDPQLGVVGDWSLADADFRDVEDLASARVAGQDEVWLADVGDNDARRTTVRLIRYAEPRLGEDRLRRTGEWELAYADGPRDAEGVFVAPDGTWVQVIEKVETGASGVYFAELDRSRRSATLRRVGQITVGGALLGTQMVTAADVSPDGRWIAVRTYGGLWEFALSEGKGTLPWTWIRSLPRSIRAPLQNQSEAVAYSPDGNSLLMTSEGAPFTLQRVAVLGNVPAGAMPATSVRSR